MLKSKENEEFLKNKIFSCFIDSLNEPNRQQVFTGRLSSLIYEWCRDHLNFNINKMGVEILDITIALLKKEDKSCLQDKLSLIKYLLFLLKNKKIEYIRKYDSKEKKEIIRMKEGFLGRKMTEAEQDECINVWYDFGIAMNESHFSITGNNDTETPLNTYINSENSLIIKNAIKTVLDKKQARSRDCYRALLTLHCIDIVDLYPELDSQIIKSCQQANCKPKQYEIYQKYHPEASKSGSEAMASKNLKELLLDLEAYLKEKNPEIFI